MPEPTPQEIEADRRDQELAHKAADVALEEGAAYVRGPAARSVAFSSACTAGMCLPSRSDIPVWSDPQLHVWESSATSQVVANPVPGVSQSPRYIVELLGPSSGEDAAAGVQTVAYRITASGWGAKRSSRIGAQTIVRVTRASDRQTLALNH
jgi:Tfp pilus assembly protein PilX